MSIRVSWRLSWRNLWRHKRRSWLTLGAMVFSNVLLVFMIGLQAGTYSMMIENSLKAFTGHLQIQAPGYQDDQKIRQVVAHVQQLAQQVREELHVDTVAARATGFAMASSEQRSFGIQITGVQPKYEPSVSSIPGLVKDGHYFSSDTAQEIVIGKVLARNLKVAVGDELTLLGSGYDGSIAAAVVIVVGIFESGITELDRTLAQMPLRSFQDTFALEDAGHAVVISAPNLSVVPGWKATLSHSFANSERVVLDWDQLQPGLKQAIQADMSSAGFMYLVLVILVAFSVLNTQLMSVLERTREFGIMLALGIKPSRLSALVIMETLLLSALGMLAGICLGGALVGYLSFTGFTYPGMEDMAGKFNLPADIYPVLNFYSIFLGPGCVFAGALLAAVYPACKILVLKPVAAMRAA